jgi:hypothetical protein
MLRAQVRAQFPLTTIRRLGKAASLVNPDFFYDFVLFHGFGWDCVADAAGVRPSAAKVMREMQLIGEQNLRTRR